MNEQEVQDLKGQVFGNQSSTQPPTTVNDVPPVTNSNSAITDTPPASADAPPVVPDTPTVIDYNAYLKETFGFNDVDEAKTQIAELRQLKDAPIDIKFENEESKQVFELLKAGKIREVKAKYDLQEKLEGVDAMSAADAIKLHIEQTNKGFKAADIQDVFEEKYTIPEKPEQEIDEEELEYKVRVDKWQQSVDKITRRIERDSISAKEELSKLKSEIKLPEIPQPESDKNTQETAASLAKAEANHKILLDDLSKLSEKDMSIQLNFSDEAKKVKFDIDYTPDKEGLKNAQEAAGNLMNFLGTTYNTEDGSPLADKLAADIYKIQNFDKIMTLMVSEAVNKTMMQMAQRQKNIGDGIQRNFTTVVPDEVTRLKQQVFGKNN